MDIVERLRSGCTCNFESTPCGAEEECRNAFDGADEIERLRKALRLAGDRVEPLASFQQKDIGSSTIRVGEETKFSRDARSFNGEK